METVGIFYEILGVTRDGVPIPLEEVEDKMFVDDEGVSDFASSMSCYDVDNFVESVFDYELFEVVKEPGCKVEEDGSYPVVRKDDHVYQFKYKKLSKAESLAASPENPEAIRYATGCYD